MAGIGQENRIARIVASHEPLECLCIQKMSAAFLWRDLRLYLHHIVAYWFERTALVLRSIGHNHHIMMLRREATISDQILSHIHRIIDTSIKLMLAAKVVDADQQGFSARHYG
jgi:hypothetical protein